MDILPYPKQWPRIAEWHELSWFTDTMETCTASDRAKSVVRTQAQQAADEGIDATPTVKLYDRKTGKSLHLSGPVDGDALLSALDLISTADPTAEETLFEKIDQRR